MMRMLMLGAAVLIVAALAAGGWNCYQANKDFTPWMSHAELDDFLKQFDTNPPGGHPNYWDKGHWINAVEARWHDGIPQYRIRYGETPQDFHCSWYWYLNQDQQSFSNHVHEFADQGYILLDPNSYLRPDDTRRYQGVWHRVNSRIVPAPEASTNSAAPPAPPPDVSPH